MTMKWQWWNEEWSEDEPIDEYYELAEHAEYVTLPEDAGTLTYWAGLNGGYATPTHTWAEIEGAYKKLNLTREPVSNLHATPDDWLDTGLWIKSLKETI